MKNPGCIVFEMLPAQRRALVVVVILCLFARSSPLWSADTDAPTTDADQSKTRLAQLIEQPQIGLLKELLSSSQISFPEPIELLDEGRRTRSIAGPKAQIIGRNDDRLIVVTAKVRPLEGAREFDRQANRETVAECAFVFDTRGQLVSVIGGRLGTTKSHDPEIVDVLCLGPADDWFVRVMRFDDHGRFDFQTEYYRLASSVVKSLRYFHYANSSAWSSGPEKTRFGTLYFNFPRVADKLTFESTGTTTNGVSVVPSLVWDGDRDQFVGASSQFARNVPLYEVDQTWSQDFRLINPTVDQIVITGGARDFDHWHAWETVIPDRVHAVAVLAIPQVDGQTSIVERPLRSGRQLLELQIKPSTDPKMSNLELRIDKTKESFILPVSLTDARSHASVVQVLDRGNIATLLDWPADKTKVTLAFTIRVQP